MSKEKTTTIRDNMDTLATEFVPDPNRPIEPTETIIGIRKIGTIMHLWLMDARTSTVRRIEVLPETIAAAWVDSVLVAFTAISDGMKAARNGV